MTIKEIKAEARRKLKGSWGVAVLACLIVTLLTGAFSITYEIKNALFFFRNIPQYEIRDIIDQISNNSKILTNINQLFNLIIGGPIAFGISKLFLNLIRGTKPQVENVFLGFKYFLKNFLIYLLIMIFSILWSLLVIIPVVIIIAIISITFIFPNNISKYSFAGDVYSFIGVIIFIGILLFVVSIVIYIITLRYEMAYYILIDNTDDEDMGSLECIDESKKIMKGNKVRLFLLNLSFIGWAILSIITFGIGFLWLIPYMNASKAVFYNDLRHIQINFNE